MGAIGGFFEQKLSHSAGRHGRSLLLHPEKATRARAENPIPHFRKLLIVRAYAL